MVNTLFIASLLPHAIRAQCAPGGLFNPIFSSTEPDNDTAATLFIDPDLGPPLFGAISVGDLKGKGDFTVGRFLGPVIDVTGEAREEQGATSFDLLQLVDECVSSAQATSGTLSQSSGLYSPSATSSSRNQGTDTSAQRPTNTAGLSQTTAPGTDSMSQSMAVSRSTSGIVLFASSSQGALLPSTNVYSSASASSTFAPSSKRPPLSESPVQSEARPISIPASTQSSSTEVAPVLPSTKTASISTGSLTAITQSKSSSVVASSRPLYPGWDGPTGEYDPDYESDWDYDGNYDADDDVDGWDDYPPRNPGLNGGNERPYPETCRGKCGKQFGQAGSYSVCLDNCRKRPTSKFASKPAKNAAKPLKKTSRPKPTVPVMFHGKGKSLPAYFTSASSDDHTSRGLLPTASHPQENSPYPTMPISNTSPNPGTDSHVSNPQAYPETNDCPSGTCSNSESDTGGGEGDDVSLAAYCPQQCNPSDPSQNKCHSSTLCTSMTGGSPSKYYCSCPAGFRATDYVASDFSKNFRITAPAQPYVLVPPGVECTTPCADQVCTEVLIRNQCV